ncbi:LysR substrate-binding domain-containing protein [Bosea vestrisii]|nr:LysR substrate-binding domain-containing protein [Bosea vestrisii]WID99531.1 LysR substrate-binding domain-containing protein [Bosea vestrisii]
MLLPSRGHGLRSIVERCAEECGILLDIKVEADNFSTLKALVRSGHGVTVLPLAPIHKDLQKGRLCAAPLVNPIPMRRLIMSYPTDRPTPRLARFAGHVISKTIEALVTQGVWSGRILEDVSIKKAGSDRKPA